MIRLLVVDDSALMRRLLGGLFAAEGDFEVAFARDGREALAAHARFRPDVVTLDVAMPGLDGLACLDGIMLERPCAVVMLSGLTAAGAEVTLDALERGAVDFIAKPSGAVSLDFDRIGPAIVQKVRAAAGARLRPALGLGARVRARTSLARHRPGGEPRPGENPRPGGDPRPGVEPRSHAQPQRAGGVRPGGLVLVGTSTGGPRALDALLSRLPADFPWPVIVAQHMPGSFTGPLARRLDGLCALGVEEVGRPLPLAPGRIYVGRGDADVIVARRPAGLVAAPIPAHPDHLWHPSVDRLVDSALDHVDPARLIGILMTGMGRDGARAMTALRARGGRTIAESEETAAVWGMPGELVRAGGADVVAPLDAIADSLLGMLP
ncbi:Protein-glutamate methylesterase/protein-glutamine glutaminase [Methylobacterium crusticola]|uniref:Protein-glutamate methylesterase/protein-glutamine glutaminase n=1 Tax=Methylobacterium crusticola TaxID=1697972 RepID=A0ABQ4QW91_9HYPH|nr:chemotaxis-specific protein-glutamate methyltransferase CheB [Methylobacterium crusticola]GJD48949.1 Protein-glutamate methylesterase/protein-glutamine glutaminase [Methylobacterium crusticola]